MQKKSKSPISILLGAALAGALFLVPVQADELELVLQAGHTQRVTDAVWLDDAYLCSGSGDGAIKLWHVPSRRVKRTLWPPADTSETPRVVDLLAAPEGLWAGYDNGQLVLWNPTEGTVLKSFTLPDSFGTNNFGLEIDAKGDLFVFGRDCGKLDRSGKFTMLPSLSGVEMLDVSSDGNRMAYYNSEGLHLDLLDQTKKLPESFANRWGVRSLVLSADGRKLFLSTSPGWIEGWDLSSDTLIFQKPLEEDNPHTEEVLRGQGYGGKDWSALITDFDDNHLLAKNNGTGELYLVDKRNGATSPWGKIEANSMVKLDLNPSRTALTGGMDGGGLDTHTVIGTKRGEEFQTERLGGESMYVPDIQSSQGKLFLASSLEGVTSFDLASGQPYRNYETGYFSQIRVSGNNLYCGGNDGVVHCYDATSGKELWNRDLTSSRARFGYGVKCLAVQPGQRLVAAGISETYPTVELLDASSGETVATLKNTAADQLLFSPDGDQLFIQRGRAVSLYDLNYRKTLHKWELPGARAGGVRALFDHPLEDSIVALDKYGSVYKINRRRLDLKPERNYIRGLPSIISANLDGSKLLVNAGRKVYRCSLSGEVLQEYGPHLAEVTESIALGNSIISAGNDSQIRIWNKQTGREQAVLMAMGEDLKDWLITTPDYHFDGSDKAQDLIEWRWNGELYQVSRFYEKFYQPGLLSQVLNTTSSKPEAQKVPPVMGSKPPQVTLVEPKDLGNGEYEIDLKIEGEHSGWDDVRLYHNGHRIPGQPPYRIKAVTGKNRLRASAFNKDKTVESLPSRLTFETKLPEQESTLYIFAAAVNEYPNRLDFAVPDAKSFAEAFRPGLYDKVEKVTLFDKEATKETIVNKLSSIDCKPQDTLLVFLAGHGTIINNRFHYLPFGSDGGTSEEALSSQELGQVLAKLPATRQVLFLDTCHAGASAKDLADLLVEKDSPLTASQQGSQFIKDQQLLARQAGTFLVAGSSPEATAAEVPQLGHGIFTYAVLSGLKDENTLKDKQITVNELLSYLNEKVPELSLKFRGSPQGIWQFSAGQDFPIAKP